MICASRCGEHSHSSSDERLTTPRHVPPESLSIAIAKIMKTGALADSEIMGLRQKPGNDTGTDPRKGGLSQPRVKTQAARSFACNKNLIQALPRLALVFHPLHSSRRYLKLMSNSLTPPLTPDQAAQAVLYGKLVIAVATTYAANLGNLTPPVQGIPKGWQLSAWIQMSDFDVLDPLKKVPAFYGIVVSQISNPTNRVVAFRGTQGKIEWLDDATAIVQVPFLPLHNGGMVAFGFDAIYSSLTIVPVPPTTQGSAAAATPKLTGTFAEQLDQLATHEEAHLGITQKSAASDGRPTVATGHSLGSALATLFALEGSVKKLFNIQLISTLASPKVGNAKFVQTFNAQPFSSWRIVNLPDKVPQLPPSLLGIDFEAVDTEYSFDSSSFAKQNEGCYHSIDTYLHGLDNSLQVAFDCLPITISVTG